MATAKKVTITEEMMSAFPEGAQVDFKVGDEVLEKDYKKALKDANKGTSVEYPEVITFTLAHPVMEFEKYDDNGVEKERIGKQYHHPKKDENGNVVFQTRSFTEKEHGENYVEIAKEFYDTNRSKIVDGKETGKPVITGHNLPVDEEGNAL